MTDIKELAKIWLANGKKMESKRKAINAMMTIEEMKKRKEELLYTYEMLSEKSGVPISTIQKVFCGATAKPRYKTLESLEMALKQPFEYADIKAEDLSFVSEEALQYVPHTDNKKNTANRIDCWYGETPSKRWPRQGEYTVADYLEIPDDIRVELIDGVIYDMGSPQLVHQSLLSHLFHCFYICIEEHNSQCEALFAPFDVRLDGDEKTMVQPDIMIICPGDRPENEYTKDDEGKRLNGAPDLAVEVLSPSTRQKDCTIKLRKYMNAGVSEYWIVDPDNEKVMVYRFNDDYLPNQYSFDDTIPIGISEGKCKIDFSKIKEKIRRV